MDMDQQLEDLAAFHESIEELAELCEKRTYDGVKDELESFLDFVIGSQLSKPLALNEQERKVVTCSLYDSIQFYKIAGTRKVGGKYIRHPIGVFVALAKAGCVSIRDLTLGLEHDIPEEYCSFVKKSGRTENEEILIAEAIAEAQKAAFFAYTRAGFDSARANSASRDIAFSLDRVTKRKGDIYYDYIGKIFSFEKEHNRSLQSARRAKVGDAYNNLEELTTPRAMMRRFDSISYDDIIGARDIETYEGLTLELGRPENHPFVTDIELEAPAWMKTTFKAVLVLYGYRNWSLQAHRRDPVIENIPLAEMIKQRSREAIDHNCTYHCGGQPGQLTPEKVCRIYDEFELYKRSGGFRGVTHSGRIPFDGLFMKFFDTSVRGESRYINTLEHDRVTMTRALLVFEQLADLYVRDRKYLPEGFTRQGLVPSRAVLG